MLFLYIVFNDFFTYFTDKSYLERLMEMPMYRDSTGHYNRQVVTKLLNNYRSHASILKEPNEMFYDSELKVSSFLQPFFSYWFATDRHTLIMNLEKKDHIQLHERPSYCNLQSNSKLRQDSSLSMPIQRGWYWEWNVLLMFISHVQPRVKVLH